jgi:phosphatidylserine decarboxylase
MLVSGLAGGLLALATTLPLAWKWDLGVRRVAVSVAAMAVGSAVVVGVLSEAAGFSRTGEILLVWALTLVVAFAVLAWRFYRDPERQPPARNDVVVSPADGEVIYIRTSEKGELPVATKHGRNYELQELTKTPLRERDAVVVGIAMSFLDVHINRSPIAGRVTLRRHFPGRFGSLGRPEMVFENERATTVIERSDIEIAVVQIASRLVRQIAAYVSPGDDVALGQRIGVIRLGSQVDVVLPKLPGLEVVVEAGARVRAGETVLATLPHARRPAAKLSP